MSKFLLLFVPFLGIMCLIGALLFTFFPTYLWVSQVIVGIAIIPIAITLMTNFMTLPLASPFLDAKLKGKTILFISRKNGSIVMRIPDGNSITNMDVDNFGTFLDNPNARKMFAGLPAYLVYEDIAVPAQLDVIKLCTRLEDAGIKTFEEWALDVNKIVYKDLDLKSVYSYVNNLAPTFINVRIERIAADLSKEYRQAWKAILPWISVMLVGLVFASISYVIIMSVVPSSAPAVASVPPSVPYVPQINP